MLLLRHGRTDWNDCGLVHGQLNVPLPSLPSGRAEVEETARALRRAIIREIWASPFRRARESAEIVTERVALEGPVLHDHRLNEIDTGLWTGRSWRDLRGDPLWVA